MRDQTPAALAVRLRRGAARRCAEQFGTRDLAGFGCDGLQPRHRRRRRAARLRAGTPSAARCRTSSGLRVERDSDYRAARRRHAAQPGNHRNPARRACAHAVLAARHLCHRMGSRLLRHWLHHPLRDRAVLSARLRCHRARCSATAAQALTRSCASCCGDVADIERITARIALRSARPRDLSGLRDSLALLAAAAGTYSLRRRARACTRAARGLPHRSQRWRPAAARDQARASRGAARRRRHRRRLRRRARRAARASRATAALSCSNWKRANARAPASPT